jgi:hypothetical protein
VPETAELVPCGLDFGYTNDLSALVAIYKHNAGYSRARVVKPRATAQLPQRKFPVAQASIRPRAVDAGPTGSVQHRFDCPAQDLDRQPAL